MTREPRVADAHRARGDSERPHGSCRAHRTVQQMLDKQSGAGRRAERGAPGAHGAGLDHGSAMMGRKRTRRSGVRVERGIIATISKENSAVLGRSERRIGPPAHGRPRPGTSAYAGGRIRSFLKRPRVFEVHRGAIRSLGCEDASARRLSRACRSSPIIRRSSDAEARELERMRQSHSAAVVEQNRYDPAPPAAGQDSQNVGPGASARGQMVIVQRHGRNDGRR